MARETDNKNFSWQSQRTPPVCAIRIDARNDLELQLGKNSAAGERRSKRAVGSTKPLLSVYS
jgi:hypothetical protein